MHNFQSGRKLRILFENHEYEYAEHRGRSVVETSVSSAYLGLPAKLPKRDSDVRSTSLRVVGQGRRVVEGAVAAGEFRDDVREIHDGVLLRVAQVHRVRVVPLHQRYQSAHQVAHVLE